jgi:hypothetical protein
MGGPATITVAGGGFPCPFAKKGAAIYVAKKP